MGICQGDPLGGALFALAHFKALGFTTSHFSSCLFPPIVNDTHIIGPFSIVSSSYEHFQTEFCVIGLSIQPQKCVTWSPFGLPLDFNTPSQRINVLEVPLGTLTFTSSFIRDALLEDVRHVDLLLKMGDVHVAFGILTCFMQCPLYFLRYTLPSSTFTESLISFDSSFLQLFGCLFNP